MNAIPSTNPTHSLEAYFSRFRRHIIGQQQTFESPFGRKSILYADWTASGRAYRPIETWLQEEILPFYGNTHTDCTITGTKMSRAYEEAKAIIKAHVHAAPEDILIFCGSGMTAAVNKLQRIMGLRLPERVTDHVRCPPIDEDARPLVLVTHMEHHSNHISWLETIATVEMIRPCENGNVDLEHLSELLWQYRRRRCKIAAITACSNVTGIETPYHAIAGMMHAHGGLCFVDFACSAPYVTIDMHPADNSAAGAAPTANAPLAGAPTTGAPTTGNSSALDAIYFSCHKFLGGPGTPGVLIFNSSLYDNHIPDQPGGGAMLYSNPWKEHEYITDIEGREDAGTPPILQGIKAGLCVRLKEEMGVKKILAREKEMLPRLFDRLSGIPGVNVLAAGNRKRLGVISFIVTDHHHNLVVKLLNDRFGIQARGGCSCAGTYGHLLLGIDKARSHEILQSLRAGELWNKPGWVRLSIHPTMTDAEIDFLSDAVEQTVASHIILS